MYKILSLPPLCTILIQSTTTSHCNCLLFFAIVATKGCRIYDQCIQFVVNTPHIVQNTLIVTCLLLQDILFGMQQSLDLPTLKNL